MTLTDFLFALAAGAGVALLASCTAGWFTILDTPHARLLERLEGHGSSAGSKAADLVNCPFCQAFWYSAAATALMHHHTNPVLMTAAVWGAACLYLAALWGRP